MMFSTVLIFTLANILNNILNEVNSAGVPNIKEYQKPTLYDINNIEFVTQKEFLNTIDYKFEALNAILKKLNTSIQDLQEKSHTWAIFHHHINSWNEGIRILENKLDIIQRRHDDQQQQLQKLELIFTNKNMKIVNEHNFFLVDELKQLFGDEHKLSNEILSKINNILRHIERTTTWETDKKSAKINTPISAFDASKGLCANLSYRIEQRLNIISQNMVQQKDIKQLSSLERRNSKNVENISQILSDLLHKQSEIATRSQKSNECCHSLSSELTTFTESSDILLKHIEKLVRNVSEKLHDIQVSTNELDKDYGSEDLDFHQNKTIKKEVSTENNVEDVQTNLSGYDNSPDVELIRPNLYGCHELRGDTSEDARIDGIYKFSIPDINEAKRDFFERYCIFPSSPIDMGSPWTLIQQRGPYKQQENFNRSWSEYRNGFGHLSRDFWFGNEFIHRLVYHDDYELRIELEDFNDNLMWAEYVVFRIDSEKYNYNLIIGEYRGNAGDAMNYHNDNDFSTYDRRNDKTVDACCSCALGYASGWWFDNCSEANLNGIYHHTPLGHNYIGVMWELWHGDYSLKKTRMMIRPRNVNIYPSIVENQNYDYTEDP